MIPPLTAICLGLMFAALINGGTTPDELRSAQAALAPASVSEADTSPGIAPLFTPEVQFWSASIVRWAAEAELDPNLAATVMQIESCGDPRARSSAGAMGLFQVMPFHFLATDDPYDPNTNARRGLDYLKRSWDKAVGNSALAFAGYNGGLSVITRGNWTWANETQRYTYWGSGIYADALNNAATSARLDEWLTAGGANLCRKAHERLGLP
jgi:soluble lytic murein transglycosylase-like protein